MTYLDPHTSQGRGTAPSRGHVDTLAANSQRISFPSLNSHRQCSLWGRALTSWRFSLTCEGPAAPNSKLPWGATKGQQKTHSPSSKGGSASPHKAPPASQHFPALPTGCFREPQMGTCHRGLRSQLKGQGCGGGTSLLSHGRNGCHWGVTLSITVCLCHPRPTWQVESLSTTMATRKDVECEQEAGHDGHTRSPSVAIGQGGQAPDTFTATLSNPSGLRVLTR